MKSILVNKKVEQIIVCVLENQKICERYIFSKNSENLLGNIYVCKIEKIMDGMQAAFVNIGKEKNAFIPIKDALPKVDVANENYEIQEKTSALKIGRAHV